MPADHGFWLDEDQCVLPVPEEPLHQNPEDPVGVVDSRSLRASSQHGELMTQGGVLQLELRSLGNQRTKQREDLCKAHVDSTRRLVAAQEWPNLAVVPTTAVGKKEDGRRYVRIEENPKKKIFVDVIFDDAEGVGVDSETKLLGLSILKDIAQYEKSIPSPFKGEG